MDEPRVNVSVSLPFGQYRELQTFAREQKLLTGTGRVNLSEAVRQAVKQGLEALPKNTMESQQHV